MITIFTIAYNESVLMKFMIDHYRSKFPNCRIVVYDNMSTDGCDKIAIENGCEVIYYDTNNKISDKKYLEIKNNCWKTATTNWVAVVDMDELIDLNKEQLLMEESLNNTLIKFEGYNMVNMEDNYDLENITYGTRCPPYDKSYVFNKKHISEINYEPGCHKCKPIGIAKYSNNIYKTYHYICIHPDLQVAKYKNYANRLSDENKKHKWGDHYNQSEEQIRETFRLARTYVEKIK